MKVKKLIDLLQKVNPEATIKMHNKDGYPMLFAVTYVNNEDIVVFEDESDNDLGSEIEARFNYAVETQMDELDFFIDFLDTGFTLEDIEKYYPERYDYSKKFMEEHGLI